MIGKLINLLIPHGKMISLVVALVGVAWLEMIFDFYKRAEFDENAMIPLGGLRSFSDHHLLRNEPCDETTFSKVFRPILADGLESIAVLFSG